MMMCLALLPCPGLRADADGTALVEMHLRDATSTAVSYNPTVQEARLQWLIRQSQERATWGDFEPALVSSYSESSLHRLNSGSEKAAQFGKAEYSESKSKFDLGLEGKLLTGASYRLGYEMSKTAGDFITGNEYASSLGLNLEQPLMKGFTRGAALAAIRLARLEVLTSFHNFRKQLISVISSVHSSYWDLVLAQERIRLASDSVRIAEDILADARERVLVGKMSELDLQEAETQLALRVAEQEDRALEEQEAGTRLQLLLADETLHGEQGINGVDPLALAEWDPQAFSAQGRDLMGLAMKSQPELAAKRAELEKEQIRLDYSRDQSLPELNAKASVGFMGLADTPDGSLQKLDSQAFPNWSVGVELRLPVLGDLKNRNSTEAARLSRELAAGQLKAAEREVALSVEALVRRVLVLGRQIESAKTEAEFKRQQLEVEQSRFDAGKSDIRRVYGLEEGLSQARARELESRRRFRKALVDLAATSGTLLRDQGLEVIQGDWITLSPSVMRRPGK
jgi:outer membrane protein TolC